MISELTYGTELEQFASRFERGLFHLYVLWACSKKPVSGTDLMEIEEQHGHQLSMGRLYPTLQKLMEEGFLRTERKKEHGKIHKYYVTTEKGVEVLKKSPGDIGEPMKRFLREWLFGSQSQN